VGGEKRIEKEKGKNGPENVLRLKTIGVFGMTLPSRNETIKGAVGLGNLWVKIRKFERFSNAEIDRRTLRLL